LIEYQEYTKSYLLACDKCRRNDAVATARTLDQAKHIASTVLRWATDTPAGVLCPSCTVLWREGKLDRQEIEATSRNRLSASVTNAS
jgi:hypothetical protein